MNSKSPPAGSPSVSPPPNSGNGKYLGLMALFGAGLVGLLVWRHFASESEAVNAVASASAAVVAPHPPPTEIPDIPPPPPVAEAGTEAPPPKVTAGGPGTNGCEQTSCGGAINDALRGALQFRAKTAHKCYDEALGQDSTLQGQVVIGLKIGNNGTVCSSSVVSSELSNPSVASCIATRFRQGARLPSPSGGCIETNVPIRLRPP